MSVMQVEVVSSEQNIYSGEASFVVVPTTTRADYEFGTPRRIAFDCSG